MELIILSCVFGAVWLITTLTFVVMYKKKGVSSSTDEKSIKQIIENQKEQNQLVSNMLLQGLKNNEVANQNTINNLTVLQKQEFEAISKRVDELTIRNEQRIEIAITFDFK